MNKINTLDLKSLVSNTINEVFDTMLSMEIELFDADSEVAGDGSRIVGSVSFAGEVMGSISIYVSGEFGRVMTAAMLGMELEEIESDEEVYDVIGELSNMVGGSLKSRFCDYGLPCELSIPSITTGSDFKIKSKNWSRYEGFAFRAFRHQQYVGFVEVYIKAGS